MMFSRQFGESVKYASPVSGSIATSLIKMPARNGKFPAPKL